MKPFQLPAHYQEPEPHLLFHPDRPGDRHQHPLIGLYEFGPFSRSLVNHVIDPIRLAFVYPHGFMPKIRSFMGEFEQRHVPRERRNYLIDFPGFSRLFGLRLTMAAADVHVELPAGIDNEVRTNLRPHLRLAEVLLNTINRLSGSRHEFDVLAIVLPEKWTAAFYGQDDGPEPTRSKHSVHDFDLHDYLKAVTAARGIPMQILLETSALTYSCRASVMWRLGIALYTKAGGVPWKLAQQQPDTAYIGLSYALRYNMTGDVAFVTCCSQVFDSDGAGLEFLVYETADVRIVRNDPFLSRDEMRRVMARSLSLYQRRHGGRVPRRVIVHKTTPFKHEEVEGCFDAWSSAEEIELLQIQQDTLWRGLLIEQPRHGNTGMPAAYPCDRGTYFALGSRELLMWTQGNVPAAIGGKNFFKEGKGIPHPLLIHRFAGYAPWAENVRAILGLTKMNWNNDALYDYLPVTLSYASTLATTVKRMPSISPRPYELRFFM